MPRSTRSSLIAAALAALLGAGCASGPGERTERPQSPTPERATDRAGSSALDRSDNIGTPHDDVVLEVPRLWVDSLGLEVDSLTATLSLDANIINLVSVTAGIDLVIDSVMLNLERVSTEAYLYVDLDNVARLVDRTIATLERNPEIVTTLLSSVDTLVSTVGNVGARAVGPGGVLTSTVDELGRTVEQTVSATGDIVERTLGTAGNLLSERNLGNLSDLEILSETTNAAGETVRRVLDTSGRVIEFVTDTAGNVTSARVLSGGR